MRKTLSRILSLSMAIFVMAASMGFTINKHYCGGELQKVTINKQAEKCPVCKKVAEVPPCHKKSIEKEKQNCCENEQDKVQTSDFSLNKKIEKQPIADFQFIALTYVILTNIHINNIDVNSFYQAYNSPLIDHDIPVEVQSFLL